MTPPNLRALVVLALASALLPACAVPRTAPLLPENAGLDAMKRRDSRHYAPTVDMSTPSTGAHVSVAAAEETAPRVPAPAAVRAPAPPVYRVPEPAPVVRDPVPAPTPRTVGRPDWTMPHAPAMPAGTKTVDLPRSALPGTEPPSPPPTVRYAPTDPAPGAGRKMTIDEYVEMLRHQQER